MNFGPEEYDEEDFPDEEDYDYSGFENEFYPDPDWEEDEDDWDEEPLEPESIDYILYGPKDGIAWGYGGDF